MAQRQHDDRHDHTELPAAHRRPRGRPNRRDAAEVLASAEVDAVAICTGADTHQALLIAAAHAGKAIFCEKPVSLDLAAVDRAMAAVATAGVALQIGFNRRFDPAHASVQGAVAAGTVGDLHIVRITSRDPAPPPTRTMDGRRWSSVWPPSDLWQNV